MFYIEVLSILAIFVLGFRILSEYDNKKDYSNISISYVAKENYILVPRKKAKPQYDREVRERFRPGTIIEYNNVYTGFIRVLQFISANYPEANERGKAKYFYKYSYEIYNPEEIFRGITPSIGDLYIESINVVLNNINNELKMSEDDLNYITEFIVDSERKLSTNESKNLIKLLMH